MSSDGTWKVVVATPIGKREVVFTIAGTGGGQPQGSASEGGSSAPFEDFKVDGNHLTWQQKITKPFPLTMTFDVTVEGDTLHGTAKAGGIPGSKVSGTRAPA
jgi:hypothetical protein